LYLDPLHERVLKNGGRVYPGGPPVILLVDIKADAAKTYAILRDQLATYKDMLTVFTNDRTETKAVTVILSGARPTDIVAAEPERLVAIDGRLPDLDANPSVHLVPLISDNWYSVFHWYGRKDMPEAVDKKMIDIVKRAHAQGRIVRFWAAPQNDYVWQKMWDAHVDLLNTDHLEKLRDFLLAHQAHAAVEK